MEKLVKISLLAMAAFTFNCGGAADNRPTNTANTNSTTKPTVAAPSKDDLKALESKAYDALKNKDPKFFEGFLSDKFVGFGVGGREDKAASIKEISGMKCDFKSYSFANEQVTPVNATTALFTAKASSDYTCGGKKGPAEAWIATVYVKEGEAWKAIYHNEAPVADPNAKPPAGAQVSVKPTAEKPIDDLTKTLVVIESKGWEAWKAKDAAAYDPLLSKDLVHLSSDGRSDKAATIRMWTEHNCEIKSWAVTEPETVPLGSDAAILTFRGNAEGKCGDKPLMNLWGTNLMIKDGEAWRSLFYLDTM
ncbi:MAG: nuclear transport factor 2 family protein [Acidobacteriota bacterium]